MKPSTVLMLLDGFRRNYLAEDVTPFLWRCAKEGEYYRGVHPSRGFCERSEILTGLRADETGFFTAIGFDLENSPYSMSFTLWTLDKMEKAALVLLRFLPEDLGGRVHRKLRAYVTRYFPSIGEKMPTYFIPYSWLPYFALTEDRADHRSPEAFPVPSILTLLEEGGGSYCYDTFTALGHDSPYATDEDRLKAVVCDARTAPKDLYLVYVAAPDAHGHRLGPDSPELQVVLRELDTKLEDFVRDMEEAKPGNRYVFLGDHGMVSVTQRLDAEEEIRRLIDVVGLRTPSDVVYFLDSTMVRFWAMSDRARSLLPGALDSSELFAASGIWVDRDTAVQNNIPWPDRRYGDFLWLANPGILVFPDFFHRLRPSRGMHGYDPTLTDSQGVCIYWGEGVESEDHAGMPLVGVFDLLRRSLFGNHADTLSAEPSLENSRT